MQDKFKSRQIDDDTYYDPAFYKFPSPEVEKKYHPYIGELVSVFNSLEETLSEELIEYIKNDKMPYAADIIVSWMSYSEKWKFWREILLTHLSMHIGNPKELSTEEQVELKEYRKKIPDMAMAFEHFGKIRNDIVHGAWGYINEQNLIKTKTTVNKRKEIVHEHIEINEENFDALIDEILEFEIEFEKYSEKIRKELNKEE